MLIDDLRVSELNPFPTLDEHVVFQMQPLWDALPEVGWQEPVRRLLDTTPCKPPYPLTWFEMRMRRGSTIVPTGVSCARRSPEHVMQELGSTPSGASAAQGREIVEHLYDLGARAFVGGIWLVEMHGIHPASLVYLPLDERLQMMPSGVDGGYHVVTLDLTRGVGTLPTSDIAKTAMVDSAWFLAYFLAFLHVRNVVVDAHDPDERLQRARVRRGKPPLVRYHTLRVVRPGTTIRGARARNEPTHTIPFHLVRGHFAHYSEQAPLFGKYAGTFWIPAHARGNPEVGTVLKDYEVAAAGKE